MEKVLLSAKQAAELSLEKGYEWFKNQIFKQIRETAERGESELHWGISNPFKTKEWFKAQHREENTIPFAKNLYKIKILLNDLGYGSKFISVIDGEDNLVTEFVVTW